MKKEIPRAADERRRQLEAGMKRVRALAEVADQKFVELVQALTALRTYAAEEVCPELDNDTLQRFGFLGPSNGTGMGSMQLARVAKFHGLGAFLRLPSEAYLSAHHPLITHIPTLPDEDK